MTINKTDRKASVPPSQQLKSVPLSHPNPCSSSIIPQANPGARWPNRKVKTFFYLSPVLGKVAQKIFAPSFCMRADWLVPLADGDVQGDDNVGPGGVQAVMLKI